jgi:hypothetical protein
VKVFDFLIFLILKFSKRPSRQEPWARLQVGPVGLSLVVFYFFILFYLFDKAPVVGEAESSLESREQLT